MKLILSRKLQLSLFFTLILGISTVFATVDPSKSPPRDTIAVNREERMEQLTSRLEEIRGMDRDTLSKAERRELRKEVKEIKKALKTETSGGIYISAGAVILIIILLILL